MAQAPFTECFVFLSNSARHSLIGEVGDGAVTSPPHPEDVLPSKMQGALRMAPVLTKRLSVFTMQNSSHLVWDLEKSSVYFSNSDYQSTTVILRFHSVSSCIAYG